MRRDLGSGAADVAQILPELRDVFPDLPPPPDAASEAARFQLFDSTVTLLRNVAFGRPTLVVLDDLQAADTASILFLRFLASQLGDMPMMVVGTYRDVELTPEHPLTTAIAELAREPVARVLELGGLPADAVGEYLRSTTSLVAPDTVVAAVWRATNGNPLFVGEAVRLLTAEGRLTDEADLTALHVAVPQGVRAVIARRIGHLGDETARALGLGAALGPEFGVDVLLRGSATSRASEPSTCSTRPSGRAAPAGRRRSGSLSLLPRSCSRDAVRRTVPGRRSRLHGRIATVLEELYAASIDAHRAELAFHFVQAALLRGVVPTRSTKASVRRRSRTRGERATTRPCHWPTRRLLASTVWRSPGSTSGAAGRPDRVQLLLASGMSCTRGRVSTPPEPLPRAGGPGPAAGDGLLACPAALGVRRPPRGRGGARHRMMPLLQDALVMLGGERRRLRVQTVDAPGLRVAELARAARRQRRRSAARRSSWRAAPVIRRRSPTPSSDGSGRRGGRITRPSGERSPRSFAASRRRSRRR